MPSEPSQPNERPDASPNGGGGPRDVVDSLADHLAPADWATADDIRRRRFPLVEQGYDPAHVQDYLSKLAGWFATLSAQIAELRRSAPPQREAPASPAADSPAASQLATRMAEMLKQAEEHASRVRAEAEQALADARAEAEQIRSVAEQEAVRRHSATQEEAGAEAGRILEDARAEGGRVLAAARAEADKAMAEARAEAERRLAEATALRSAILEELRAVVQRLGAMGAAEPRAAGPVSPVGPQGPEPSSAGPQGQADGERRHAFIGRRRQV